MSGRVHAMPVADAYALWASTYDAGPNPLLALEERIVRPLLPVLTGITAVDVACGTGRWLMHLVAGGAKMAAGIDASPGMLLQARSKPLLARRLVAGDCQALPLQTSSVDLVLCSFCVDYIPDLQRFAAELARAVRPGGEIFVSDFHPSAHGRGWKRSFRHEEKRIEIACFERPLAQLVDVFEAEGLALEMCLEPGFEEADRAIFERCGKPELYLQVRGEPAIFVCRLISRARSGTMVSDWPLVYLPASDRKGSDTIVPGRLPVIISEAIGDNGVRPPAEGWACPLESGGSRASHVRSRSGTPCGIAGKTRDAAVSLTQGDRPRPVVLSQSLWLTGGRIASSSREAACGSVEIRDGRIHRVVYGGSLYIESSDHINVNLDGYLILPGLVNAHDHLEFNLFPRLGHGPYGNAEAWARDIFQPERSPVHDHVSVPKSVRLWWGGIKNLLSGVTTVSHHNPYDPLFDDGFPIDVVRRYGWAHSLAFDSDVAGVFRRTDSASPFIIHAGEGTDRAAQDEVFVLDRLGVLSSRTVLVHGVGFNDEGHALWRNRGAALVWCPTSNRFTLGTTLNRALVGSLDRMALGNDSALTADGTLLDELRAAHDREGIESHRLYRMVTESAAEILRLNDGEGRIQPGSRANLIAVRWTGAAPADVLIGLGIEQVEMVLVRGRLQSTSSAMGSRWPEEATEGLEPVVVEGIERRVRAPVSWLLSEAAAGLPAGFRLAGRRISA